MEMTQGQLEWAWLGCVFKEPERSRKVGLVGLDRSMFKDPELFDLGLELMQSFFDGNESTLSEELLIKLLNLGALSKIWRLDESVGFLAAYFKVYAVEIEKRAQDWDL